MLTGEPLGFGLGAEPDEELVQARKDKYIWLVEMDGKSELVMAVAGRIPATAKRVKLDPCGVIGPDPDFSMFSLKGRLAACQPPFKYDFDGSVTGARVYYREKQPAGELPPCDAIPEGASLSQTNPKMNKKTNVMGLPSWKLDLPLEIMLEMHPRFQREPSGAAASSSADADEEAPVKRARLVISPEPSSDEE